MTGKPLITCLDQEGGYVGRFREREILYPAPMALSASRSDAFLFSAGYYPNRLLMEHGINMNLSPVLDVGVNPFNPSLGPRSFSKSTSEVIRCYEKWMKGARKSGLLITAKHFPGKGRSHTDSHLVLPKVDASLKELRRCDLKPFKKAVDSGIDAVMTSHAWYAGIEKKTLPGTFSRKINHDLLRSSLKFQGILVSDDLEMGAIAGNYDLGKAAVDAVKSGVDAVLVCKEPKYIRRVFQALTKAVESGEIGADVIQESRKRKSIIKQKIVRIQKKAKEISLRDLKRDSLRVLNKESPKALNVLKGKKWLPVAEGKKVTAVIPERHPRILVEDRKNELRDFEVLLRKAGQKKRTDIILYKDLNDLKRKIKKKGLSDHILFFSSDLFKDVVQQSAFDLLSKSGGKISVILVKNPVDYSYVKDRCLTAIATYCFTYDIQSSLIRLYFGLKDI